MYCCHCGREHHLSPHWEVECKKTESSFQRRASQQERDVEAMVQELGGAPSAAADAARRDSSLLQLPRLIMDTIARVMQPRSRLGSMVAVPATASNTPGGSRSGSISNTPGGSVAQQRGSEAVGSGALTFIKRALSRPSSRATSRQGSRATSRLSSRATSRRSSHALLGGALVGRRVRVCMKGRGGEPDEYFNGTIDRYHARDGFHIQYDDGDVGWEPDRTSFQLIDDKDRAQSPSPPKMSLAGRSPRALSPRALSSSPLVPGRTLPARSSPLVPGRPLPAR